MRGAPLQRHEPHSEAPRALLVRLNPLRIAGAPTGPSDVSVPDATLRHRASRHDPTSGVRRAATLDQRRGVSRAPRGRRELASLQQRVTATTTPARCENLAPIKSRGTALVVDLHDHPDVPAPRALGPVGTLTTTHVPPEIRGRTASRVRVRRRVARRRLEVPRRGPVVRRATARRAHQHP